MPTKYDVFAELIEKAPCTAKEIGFKVPIYNHLKSLIKEKLIKKEENKYIPIKNQKSQAIFSIIKYCLKNGLNYNLVLSKNMPKVLQELFAKVPKLRPKAIINNKENTEIMKFLEQNQFILITKKKPRQGIILKHQLFEEIKKLHQIKDQFKTTEFMDLLNEAKKLKFEELNPFNNKIFEFLSGSAALEGSTITAGETRDLILNDIYPKKPEKDIQMIKNLNEAIHYIHEHITEEISEEHIKELNKIIMFGMHRNAGKYKTVQNKIQGNPNFKTSHPSKVKEEIKAFCKKLNKIKSKEECLKEMSYIHNEFQHIHPFSDGNSRTTRMVLNWILLKNKIPLLVIKMGCFEEYMSLTKLSKERDDKKLNKLFHHILIHENLIN